jgi:uncharacterized protein YbjT (DUF2867 family)
MSEAPTGLLYLQADVPFDREIGKLQQQHEHDHVLWSRADLIVEPIGIAGPLPKTRLCLRPNSSVPPRGTIASAPL